MNYDGDDPERVFGQTFTITVRPPNQPPTATLVATNVTIGEKPQTTYGFMVNYGDDVGINASTLDGTYTVTLRANEVTAFIQGRTPVPPAEFFDFIAVPLVDRQLGNFAA